MQNDLDLSRFWEAHDNPGRPFDGFVLVCACVDCETAIRNEARRSPQRPIFLKTGFDRIGITLEYFVEVIDRGSVDELLYVQGDYLRDVYFSDERWLPNRTRWFSVACAEDEKADGREVRRRRVAIRQSAKARNRRDAEARAWAKPAPARPARRAADAG